MSHQSGRAVVLCAALVFIGAPASAQFFTGRIDVTATDATGAVLPGVDVELSGPLNQSAVTDMQGEAHFLNLPVGTYTVKTMLSGFVDYVNTNVPVAAGAAIPLRVTLRVAGIAEQVEVTAESPVVDLKKQATATNVGLEELQNVPSARDPWVVMQTVPAIIVDRVNVGGSESGQQSTTSAKGAGMTENTWNLDGIPITDMAATGGSPTYYDFDMFQEMQVTTGGADPRNPTAGVQLNFVLKQGTNTPHGSARVYFENEDLQSDNLSAHLARAIGGSSRPCLESNYEKHCGNRTDQYSDYGFELGGPIVRDRLWAWGSMGKTDVRIRALTGLLDRTILKNYALKAQAQLNSSIRASYTFFEGNKVKHGRNASATRPPETTWNQDGPTYVNKFEANVVVGQNLFVTARGAHSPSGFALRPIGGLDAQAYRDTARVWHGSYLDYSSDRPQDSILADANWFRGKHEIKFGFSWRKASVDSTTRWPGYGWYNLHRGTYAATGSILAVALRPRKATTEGKYASFYIGDTISMNRMTVSLALRYDDQRSSVLSAVQPALPGAPSLMPSVTVPGVNDAIVFKSASPRAGITYALDQARKTLVRASYALFSSQLGAADAGFVSAASYAYLYILGTDANRNGYLEPGELGPTVGAVGFDPAHPTATVAYNRTDPDLRSTRTHELVFGFDRELAPNLGFSTSVTWRRFQDLRWFPLIGVTRKDYLVDGVVTGNLSPVGSFSQTYYAVDPAKIPPGAGQISQNRPGYHQRFLGWEAHATKRMSNRYMFRLGFSTNDHREYFDDPNMAILDPTPTPGNPLKDGGLVVRSSGGSGKSGIFLISPRYQFIANGMWEGPVGINLGMNLLVRQGFAEPFFALTETSDETNPDKNVLVVGEVDRFRLPAVTSLDFRVEKAFKVNRATVAIDLDVFNLLNSDTVLGRQYDVNSPASAPTGFNKVLEIMNPRIARLGARLTF
ncbi:MAG: TonB-dependent receptor [Acidobacteria bacterium]|nr:TonB-dependent receptor [Acidobacteriota bacterium]